MKVLSDKELKAKLLEKMSESSADASFLKELAQDCKGVEKKGNSKNENPSDEKKSIEKYLLTLLARRECSALELKNKLKEKNFDENLASDILQNFIDEDYQSDQRFCEMFIRSRITKNVGPFKIRMELNAKGVSSSIVEKCFSNSECDWFELALQTAKKKTASWKSFEFEDKAKLMRFLQGKGFEQEQIRYAVENVMCK